MKQQNLLKRSLPHSCIVFLATIFTSKVSHMQQSLINVGGWNAYVHLPWDYNANPTTIISNHYFLSRLG